MEKITGEAPEVRSKKGNQERKKREKREKKEREKREIERKGERKERNGEKKISRVNYYRSAFNSQKHQLNILAEMFEISKSGYCADLYIIDHHHYKSSCQS